MITNPLLEEIWAVKDRFNAECGGDMHVFCEQLRAWSAEHLPKDLVLITPEEFVRSCEEQETGTLVLREDAPDSR